MLTNESTNLSSSSPSLLWTFYRALYISSALVPSPGPKPELLFKQQDEIQRKHASYQNKGN